MVSKVENGAPSLKEQAEMQASEKSFFQVPKIRIMETKNLKWWGRMGRKGVRHSLWFSLFMHPYHIQFHLTTWIGYIHGSIILCKCKWGPSKATWRSLYSVQIDSLHWIWRSFSFIGFVPYSRQRQARYLPDADPLAAFHAQYIFMFI